MKFANYAIAEEIKENLVELGFKRPTDIQYKAIPSILRGEDVLAIAQTGTGKTAAFAIPLLHHLIEMKEAAPNQGVQVIVLVPTRELAIQINGVIEKLAWGTDVVTAAIVGGVRQNPQIKALKTGVDLVVCTPGRMFDLIAQGWLQVQAVKAIVFDEADHMLKLGFLKDIQDISKKLPRQRQTLFFSATINDNIKRLAYKLVNNKAIRIQLSPKDPVSKNVTHYVTHIDMDDKRFFLERLIHENEDQKILVFVRTRVRAERVMKALQRVQINSMTIHAGKDQHDRLHALDLFEQGKISVLIATDVTARGIDIPNVEYVVNYDLPTEPENYVHRVGRTGRGNNKGYAVSFCSPNETDLLKEIEQYVTKPISELKIPKKDYSATIEFSDNETKDWRKLMEDDNAAQAAFKKEKKRKKKK